MSKDQNQKRPQAKPEGEAITEEQPVARKRPIDVTVLPKPGDPGYAPPVPKGERYAIDRMGRRKAIVESDR